MLKGLVHPRATQLLEKDREESVTFRLRLGKPGDYDCPINVYKAPRDISQPHNVK